MSQGMQLVFFPEVAGFQVRMKDVTKNAKAASH